MRRNLAVMITPEYSGQRMLDFLASRFTYRSRDEWQQELLAHRFLLNGGQALNPQTLLQAGDRLIYLLPEIVEPPVDTNYAVLYEDADLLAVDKPSNLPCHPGGRYFQHTLWALLREKHGLKSPCLINRLDRETSGIVLIAKNKKTARHCNQQFAECRVHKSYLVLVEGEFPASGQEAQGCLALDPVSAIRKKVRFYPAGVEGDLPPVTAQACSTSVQRLHYANSLSLLRAKPRTGRCHQIRATLLSLGFPVVGDKLYGLDEQFFLRFQQDRLTGSDHKRLRLHRQALHAELLGLQHPSSGSELEFKAPCPAVFRTLLTGDNNTMLMNT